MFYDKRAEEGIMGGRMDGGCSEREQDPYLGTAEKRRRRRIRRTRNGT